MTKKEANKRYFRDYQRRRRLEDTKKGLCVSCRKQTPEAGRTCCATCLDEKRIRIRFGTALPFRGLRDTLHEEQGGLCAVCDSPLTGGVLDYSPHSATVRGLLCTRCMRVLTLFKYDPQLFMRTITYLTQETSHKKP